MIKTIRTMVKMGNRKIKVTYCILTMIKTSRTMVKMGNRKIKVMVVNLIFHATFNGGH